MRGDRGSRNGETGWWSSRAGWLDGEKFAKVRKGRQVCVKHDA